MRTPSKLYTLPQICPKNPTPRDIHKIWMVYFRFFDVNSQKWVRQPFKGGINRFKVFKERLAEANALKETLLENLQKGWNPLTKEIPSPDINLDALNDLSKMAFHKAITFALTKCKVSPTTYSNYSNSSKRIMKAAKSVDVPGTDIKYNFCNLPINAIKKKHIKLLLDQCTRKYKWTNKSYNKNLGYFRAVLSRLEEYEVIQINPAYKIKDLPITETKKFKAYTKAEKKRIRDHLFMNHYGFYVYLMVLYQTGIRPKEILALRQKDIDLEKRLITIEPDIDRQNSKTRSIREVAITESLYLLLREWKKHDHVGNCYFFGSPYKAGGNRGSAIGGLTGALHPDYFKPSMTRIKRDTITRLWNKIVMVELGINKYLYAAKHTGADDKILAGIPLEALKDMYGHSSKLMTMTYITKLQEIHRKQIAEQSPEF